MPHSAALPFILKRGDDVFDDEGMTMTRETVHGLLRLDGERLVIQWRVARRTDHLGTEMRTDKEVEPVREIVVPIESVAGSFVRHRWWHWLTGPRLVLTASDLRAFEAVAGAEGLKLSHPAELVLRLRRGDRLAGEEFSAELALAVAESALRASDARRSIRTESDTRRRLPETAAEPTSQEER